MYNRKIDRQKNNREHLSTTVSGNIPSGFSCLQHVHLEP